MAKKIPFTPASIDNLTGGLLADPLTPGLAIEVLGSGKKRWRYRRQVAGKKVVATLFGGVYPSHPIAVARDWARQLNELVEIGVDPRVKQREDRARDEMTIAKAHQLYMLAVREGRASKFKKVAKPRTVKTKLEIFRYSIAPKLGDRVIYEVSEKDLIDLVEIKGRTAKVQANRLAAELKVFFGWASSLMGSVVDLKVNPALRLSDLHHPEKPKARVLSRQELGWFLEAIVPEPYQFQRGFLLLLLTATRLSEVTQAKSDEFSSGMWTIPAGRTKNSLEHKIALGPWARRLVHSNHEWLFPSARREGAKSNSIWWESRRRIHSRMEKIAGIQLEPFTPHDLRRTVRSNTKRLGIDFETAEAMLNHSKKGLERIYDRYELEEEKRISFLKWENEIISIARSVGVEEALNVPTY